MRGVIQKKVHCKHCASLMCYHDLQLCYKDKYTTKGFFFFVNVNITILCYGTEGKSDLSCSICIAFYSMFSFVHLFI